MNIKRGPGSNLDPQDLLNAAEEYFQVDVEFLLSEALESLTSLEILDLADKLNFQIPPRNRAAMEKEA